MRGRRWLRVLPAFVLAVVLGGPVAAFAASTSVGPQTNLAHVSRGLFGLPPWWRLGPGPGFPPPLAPGSVQVIASGLNQPKKLTVAPDGSLIVALSGDGNAPASCTDGSEASCLDNSGAVDRVTPDGHVTTLLAGLPSVSGGPGPGAEATGPAEAGFIDGRLQVLFQDTNIDPTTGNETYGPGGGLLGDLAAFPPFGGPPDVEASFGPFEAAHNPDNGAGTAVTLGQESAIDSDPYSFVPYHGGVVVADAAANDLLFVAPSGAISVLAVFPTISEAGGAFAAQAVPDSVAVGPDGALYVGELGGAPFQVGTESVFRVVPGQPPTVYASGFTMIGDIAFDRAGQLLVLEIDQAGLGDPALASGGPPTPGAIIGVRRNGVQTLLASTGLEFPTGMTVTPDGSVYVSNYGTSPASGGPGGLSGEVVRVSLPWSWEHAGW
jgi:glucose/arabinose dehydrogenase